ncbi:MULTISPECIES: class A sortase [Lactobacillus]|jgi:sortase family protein|uniref:class A sortase n=1 Tax=Lactobacillus TaxID=1578 RepID=UPI00118FF874|nr:MULTISPECIES: class A sortase [Lactobacillus]MCZ3724190.1 class A sortase [Lactobacillus jensenii]MCZ3725713.1 class A sortase [Lactobacillus jensenii]MCZ3727153.1 class A sortase [Lactobacillus jensenii]MCZ3728701.1 class A sortase [Lactobacillus jensenii]MCZ3730271.1 class A sortase [Lactobacillus jensenii]
MTIFKRKGIVITSLIVILIGILGFWKYQSDLANQNLLNRRINAPITRKMPRATLKKSSIKQFTDDDLLKYRKAAFNMNLNKYPNGYLDIPSIGVYLPIYNRANNYTLSLGVGKDYFLDSEMGQGNFVLAGHNMERPHVLLSDLYKVKIGQKIILHGQDRNYEYSITSKQVVSPYVKFVNGQAAAGSAFYLPKGNETPLVTVYTCAAGGATRLVVQGTLNEGENY